MGRRAGRGLSRITSLILTGLPWLTGLSAQMLTVTPTRVLMDESADIRAQGLQPGEHLLLSAALIDGAGQPWRSEVEVVADAQGSLDLSTQAPVKGSYKGVSGMGLIWSMMPAGKGITVYRPPREPVPQKVDFQLVRDGKTVATAQFEQEPVAAGVRQVSLTGQLHGAVFWPAGGGPHPGVLVLGGSEGGVPLRRAAWLASRGYAALALAYFRYDNLPQQLEAIPLEYFGMALLWMRDRPEILPDQIAVMGVSRGAELALQLGSMYPQIKAVVAYAPANVRYRSCCGGNLFPYAWTWKGAPLPFVGLDRYRSDAPQAKIPVENTSGPILLIAGEQDHIWDSAGMARAIGERLKHAHFRAEVINLTYPRAGHIAGRPEIVPEWHGQLTHPISGRPTDYGGSPEGNALSSIDASPKVLDFLQRNLIALSSK
jgi:dienelactone hydrolase